MKKILVALMLGFISIMFIACGGSQPKSSTQNINVSANESTTEWESLGEVNCFKGGYSHYGATTFRGVSVWVKQIGGKVYYQARMHNRVYALTPNPYYGESCYAGQARYKFSDAGTDYFVVF